MCCLKYRITEWVLVYWEVLTYQYCANTLTYLFETGRGVANLIEHGPLHCSHIDVGIVG